MCFPNRTDLVKIIFIYRTLSLLFYLISLLHTYIIEKRNGISEQLHFCSTQVHWVTGSHYYKNKVEAKEQDIFI